MMGMRDRETGLVELAEERCDGKSLIVTDWKRFGLPPRLFHD